jgi:hypothetical protein
MKRNNEKQATMHMLIMSRNKKKTKHIIAYPLIHHLSLSSMICDISNACISAVPVLTFVGLPAFKESHSRNRLARRWKAKIKADILSLAESENLGCIW